MRAFLTICLLSIGIMLLAFKAATGLAGSDRFLSAPHAGVAQHIVSAPQEPDSAALNCRYGVAAWGKQTSWLPQLGTGWTINFTYRPSQPVDGVEFVPVIRMKQARDGNGNYLPYVNFDPPLNDSPGGLGSFIASQPGALWFIGNEVDRVYWQDETFPDVYARAYHDAYHFIKARDPNAQIGISGLVEVTPSRLQYLDIVWNSYLQTYGTPMPVDVWNMHVYVLPEIHQDGVTPAQAGIALGTDPALAMKHSDLDPDQCSREDVYCYAEHDNLSIFQQQVVWMRQWMKSHGQKEKPLLLSEFSLLYPYTVDPGGSCFLQDEFGNCFPPSRVNAFMDSTFAYLESAIDPALGYSLDNNRLVQQWLWFSINDETADWQESASSLVNYPADSNSSLTEVGQNFQQEVTSRALYRNLRLGPVAGVAVQDPSGTTTATLKARVYNNGNMPILQSFTVSFYKDAAMTNLIGQETIAPTVMGCARRDYEVSVEWPDLGPGKHRFWVMADSGGVIVESPSDDADNKGSAYVLVNPEQQMLPAIER